MSISWTLSVRLAIVALVAMVVLNMQPPSYWSVTQYFFTYDLGFQRRSLLGEMLSWVYPEGMTIRDVHLWAATSTLASIVALTWYFARSLKDAPMGGILLLLFVTSVGMATYMGNSGYLDAYLVLLCIPALLIRKNGVAPMLIASLLLAVATLFHENALPYFAVLLGYHTWLQNPERPVPSRFVLSLGPIIITGIAAALVMKLGTQPPELIDALRQLAKDRALGVTLRIQAFEPLVDLRDEGGGQLASVWSSWFFKFRLFVFGGFGAALLLFMVGLFVSASAHRSLLDRILFCLAAMAPAAILIVAFDISRFLAVAMLTTYLAAAVLAREDMTFRENLTKRFTPPVVVALLLIHGLTGLRDLNAGPSVPREFPGGILYHLAWGTQDNYVFMNGYTLMPDAPELPAQDDSPLPD